MRERGAEEVIYAWMMTGTPEGGYLAGQHIFSSP
jgi:hypothetical protein